MTTKIIDRCPICGGNAGRIPEGGHYLCQERAKRGLPTPNLGERCTHCRGTGRISRVPLHAILPMLPSGREIEMWFPPCPACAGTGYINPDRGGE